MIRLVYLGLISLLSFQSISKAADAIRSPFFDEIGAKKNSRKRTYFDPIDCYMSIDPNTLVVTIHENNTAQHNKAIPTIQPHIIVGGAIIVVILVSLCLAKLNQKSHQQEEPIVEDETDG